jgi:hydrogenase maturation protease
VTSDDGRVVVIGVGNEFRGDDGAGPEVVARLRGQAPDSVELVLSDGEPTRLLEAWSGATVAVVVDAVTGSPATIGRLHRVVISETESRESEAVAGDAGQASSHSLGLGTAIGLARALGRMPETLVVHGVEATDFSQGHGLSAAVAAAIDGLAAAVLTDVGTAQA